jgi:hypothetical protein
MTGARFKRALAGNQVIKQSGNRATGNQRAGESANAKDRVTAWQKSLW